MAVVTVSIGSNPTVLTEKRDLGERHPTWPGKQGRAADRWGRKKARAAVAQHCGSSPAIPTALGGVTEAHRSDTATAVVQLHPKRLLQGGSHGSSPVKQMSPRPNTGSWCNGSTASFYLASGGSNPPGPIDSWACNSMVRAGSL